MKDDGVDIGNHWNKQKSYFSENNKNHPDRIERGPPSDYLG
jgi:hypothetical protein